MVLRAVDFSANGWLAKGASALMWKLVQRRSAQLAG
jgi:hypothetical protein